MKMLHENELINIEEDMILQPGHLIRSFTLHNRINGLKAVVINVGATVSSVKLDFGKDEIIRSHRDNNDDHEWQSHVLGLDTLLLNVTHSNNSTLMYQLTSDDELVMIGKFRGQQHLDLAMPFFYNLNPDSPTIEGHYVHVRCASEDPGSDRFPTLSVIGEEPYDFAGSDPVRIDYSDDFARGKDIVYCATGDISTLIIVTLSYGSRTVEATLKSNSQANNTSNNINCRVRLRIRKYGISIMPSFMTEFKMTYKFFW